VGRVLGGPSGHRAEPFPLAQVAGAHLPTHLHLTLGPSCKISLPGRSPSPITAAPDRPIDLPREPNPSLPQPPPSLLLPHAASSSSSWRHGGPWEQRRPSLEPMGRRPMARGDGARGRRPTARGRHPPARQRGGAAAQWRPYTTAWGVSSLFFMHDGRCR
jgi:hypothetical protein